MYCRVFRCFNSIIDLKIKNVYMFFNVLICFHMFLNGLHVFICFKCFFKFLYIIYIFLNVLCGFCILFAEN